MKELGKGEASSETPAELLDGVEGACPPQPLSIFNLERASQLLRRKFQSQFTRSAQNLLPIVWHLDMQAYINAEDVG
jgi:hypothetical protein